ncbi:MAG: methyltransferase domain-containing protein [Acidobacteria bacterium]|nr:methyltransferase domain-containing protein [Acidobacteriota bacterium]
MRRLLRVALVLAALGALLLAAREGLRWYARGPWVQREADRLAALAEIRPGMTVAEIGAGQGRLAVLVARRLGPAGRLYATELGAENLAALRRAASAGGVEMVVLEAGEHSANLAADCCDVVFMRRVYHHLSDPEPIVRGLYAALRPGGRLAVIDMLSPRLAFWGRHGIAAETVVPRVVSAGFQLENRVNWWSPIDYCLVFRKPAQRGL